MQIAGLALISAAVLGLELALMRVWAITQFHHFAYLMISTALLGFGASGTALSLVRSWAVRRWRVIAHVSALAFCVSVPVSFALAQRLPVQPLELLWVPSQWCWVLVSQLLVLAPFLFGALCIGVMLIANAARADRWYAANLVGSGLGAAGMVGLSYLLPAPWLAASTAALGLFAAAVLLPRRSAALLATTVAVWAAVALAYLLTPVVALRINEFKTLPTLQRLRDSRVVARRHGPLGQLDVVAGPAIHEVIDLSPLFSGEIPPQMVLTTDAGRGTALTQIAQRDDARFLDWSVLAAPYHVIRPASVLIVGAGGGADIHLARYHRAAEITALELNRQVVELVRGPFAAAAGDPYRQAGVRVVVAEARGWLERMERRFDLISVPLLDSFAAASAGVYALNESYLYTVEAIERMLARLTDGGCLSIVRSVQLPPRDTIKLLATFVEALRRRGVTRPENHVMMLRLQFAANLIVSPAPFSAEQVARFRRFADSRNFQTVWYPGMPADEAGNRHELGTFTAEGAYTGRAAIHDAAKALFFGDAERFYGESLFDVRPATDDRPYYFHFFRWKLLPVLRKLGPQWAAQIEYGYAVLVVTLVQAVVLAGVLILLPLRRLRRQAAAARGKPATAGYFACLGLAYLCLEMAFIQKLALYLAHPVLAAAVVLAGFLVFSGVGSVLGRRLTKRPARAVTTAVVVIVAVGLAYTLLLPLLLGPLAGSSLFFRGVVALVVLAPLAIPMGVPFSQGLIQLDAGEPAYLPWAWGVNGFASVIAGPFAVVFAMSFGFGALVWFALGLYVLAGVVRHRMPGPPAAND